MTLIKSISGIRGTVGGCPGDNLTPLDIVKFVSDYVTWLKTGAGKKKAKIVLGRMPGCRAICMPNWWLQH